MAQTVVEDSIADMEMNVDRISTLPWDIQDMILGKLPICDAVRTSMLSCGWRYKWLGLSSLDVDTAGVLDSLETEKQTKGLSLTRIVNHFLFNHHGNLRRFSVKTYCDKNKSWVYNWLHFISRRGVQEFTLEELDYVYFELPSYVFLYDQLRSLDLCHCIMKVPVNFRGFKSLTQLSLRKMPMTNEGVECLIFTCPAVERLTLLCLVDVNNIRIRGSALKSLSIDSGYEVIIHDAPQLCVVDIAWSTHRQYQRSITDWQSFIHSLSSLPSLERLRVDGDYVELWAKELVLERFPLANQHLTTLVLDEVKFDTADALRVFCSLIWSCPNIHTFNFSVTPKCSRAAAGFFLEGHHRNISFPKLKKVMLRYGNQMGAAFDFLSFIIRRSPLLESATFIKEGDSRISQRTLERIYRQLQRTAGNSNAEVKFIAKVEPSDPPSSSRKRRGESVDDGA